ncbi:MAG TPA: NADH-quinone oxidoreductase subunit J [Nannocystaceae bacterium]|nr:NADH-quinone oxidoreductase subunit J [Nannocystaceae bacterium]
MTGQMLVFYAFAALALVSALATITRRNPVVAAVWLVSTFFAVAVCYLLLSASFLAAIQILVYAGAIMVLFVFVIMVLDVDERGRVEHRRPSRVARIGYYGTVIIAGGFLAFVLVGTLARQYLQPGIDLAGKPDFGSAEAIGRVLFTDYLFAFEAVSLLLLAAVIGAVVVARNRREREKHATQVAMGAEARDAAGLAPEPGGIAPPGPTPVTDFGAPSATGHDGGT